MEAKSSSFDYAKNIPFFTALLIFFSVMRLRAYYESFNLDALKYFDFSELILSFMDVIYTLILMALTGYIQTFIVKDRSIVESQKKSEEELMGDIAFKVRLGHYITLFQIPIFIVVGLGIVNALLAIFKWNFYTLKEFGISSLFLAIFFIGFIAFMEIIYKMRRLGYSKKSQSLVSVGILILIAFIYMLFLTQKEVDLVKDSRKFRGTVITFNDSSKHISDSFNYYIGKSANYIFTYNSKTEMSTVFKMSDVKTVSYPKIKWK